MKLRLALELENQLFMEEKVKISVLREVGPIFDGEGFIRLGAGTEIDVPRWLANYLVQRGFAKLSNEIDIFKASKEVSKFKFLENKYKDSPYPVKLPTHFYKTIRQLVITTLSRVETLNFNELENVTNVLNKAIRIKNDLEELTEVRILKMFKYILSEKELSVEMLERLTPEEVALCNELSDTLKLWLGKVLPHGGDTE